MTGNQAELQTLLEQAKQLADGHRYEEARQLYARVGQESPEQTEAWMGLALACLRQKRYSECLEAVAKALTLDARQVPPHLIAASAFNSLGRYADAIQAVDAALAIAPDHLQALNSKTDTLLKQRRYAEVLPLTERILKIDPVNTSAYLNRGVALHGLGQSLAALEAFDRLLAIKPDHANALINRSSILMALDRPEDALQAADAALQIQPDGIIALLNRTAALLRLRQPREALATAERLLQHNSRHIKGLINKIIALLDLWRFEEALATTFKALTLDSFNPDLLELKIQALLGLKRFAEAATEGQKALLRHPERVTLKLGLARALVELRRFTEAESFVDAILAAVPHQPEAVSLKAEILFSRNEQDAGQVWIEQALAIHPEQAHLWMIKSVILLAGRRYAEALAAAERALTLQPHYIQAAINRIAALNCLQRFAEALAAAQELLASGIRDWQLYANQGGALAGLERFEEARQAFARADELDKTAFQAFRWQHEIYGVAPDALLPELDPHAEYLALKLGHLENCDWSEYVAVVERAQVLIEQGLAAGRLSPLPPFKSLTLPFSPELTFAIARSRGEFLESGMAAVRQRLAFTYSVAMERLRIGYVSADFRNHPTAHLMRSLFRAHDCERFEIFIYALCEDDGSPYYQQIKADADQFVELTGMSNADAAARIHADGIHILIDLMGYTNYARTEIFALRPAPLQASYLGYPGTLGASFIDYILADAIVLPETLRPYFTEQPVYLPECYQINDYEQEIAATGIRRCDVGLPEMGFVFCCFNKPAKLDPTMFSVWARILQQVSDSVLWLLAADPETTTALRRLAEARGIPGERLIFAERMPKAQHLERHRLADLFLDTRLYNAHTTASDALWAGLPVLTCMGEMFPARVAASLLHAVGLPELITHSLEEYEEQAVRLATRPAELATLRAKLAANRLRMPLFDTERFARHLEQAYDLMWKRYSQGLAPAPLWVPPLPVRG